MSHLAATPQKILNRRGEIIHEGEFFSPRGCLKDAIRKRKSLLGIDLQGFNLSGMDLSGVDFTAADLRNVNFYGANVTGATFNGSNLKLATFKYNAEIQDGAFDGAVNLEDIDIMDDRGQEIDGAYMSPNGIILPEEVADVSAVSALTGMEKTSRPRL
ncbi:MAG: hypothetical protein Alpg2KO_12230 [Alphaproteobacteria bacterium]